MSDKVERSVRARRVRFIRFCIYAPPVTALCLTASSAQAAQSLYRITPLMGLGADSTGRSANRANAINAAGDIVGYATIYSDGRIWGSRAVRWSAGQSIPTVLDDFDNGGVYGTTNSANGINARGDVAGTVTRLIDSKSAPTSLPIRWAAGQTALSELEHLWANSQGTVTAGAGGINAAGDTVGYTYKPDGGYRAVRWMAGDTRATELGYLGTDRFGMTQSSASAINNRGDAVGYARLGGPNSSGRAVLWKAGETAPVDLGLSSPEATDAVARAINDAGVVVGFSQYRHQGTDVGSRAVRWESGQSATELGHLGTNLAGATLSAASAVDSNGNAVGMADVYSGDKLLGTHATFWPAGETRAIDLNSLIDPTSGWVLLEASGINDSGTIIGLGLHDPDGAGPIPARDMAVRLDPVPEPGVVTSVAVLGLGVLGRRCRRVSLTAS